MSKTSHKIFLGVLVAVALFALVFPVYRGISYYSLDINQRVHHLDHNTLKPSGFLGHGYGIAGSLSLIIGVGSYMARKRYRFMSRLGLLKYWLEFHIFLCTLGPLLVLFHTAFKFGGIVAVSFWSMVAVFLSGILGRFIYIRIPRSIEGRALSLGEVMELKAALTENLRANYNFEEDSFSILTESMQMNIDTYHHNPVVRYFRKRADNRRTMQSVRGILRKSRLPSAELRQVVRLIKDGIRLNRRIDTLDTMEKLFRYWHIVHLPFAIIMLIIMVIHISVVILFGYRWIF